MSFPPRKETVSKRSLHRLLLAMIDSDEQAYAEIARRFLPTIDRAVKAQCRHFGVPMEKAADVVQTVFLKAIEHVQKARTQGLADGKELRMGWFLTVATNEVKSLSRKLKYDFRPVPEYPVEPADGRPDPRHAAELRDEILKFLTWLEDDERDLVERHYLKCQPMSQIAEDFGVSVDAARKKHQRAMRHLRDLIEQHGECKLPSMNRPAPPK